MEAKIGINQRIPMATLELALKAVLDGHYDDSYAAELARMDYHGENRINKAVKIINKLTRLNPLMPYLIENKDKVKLAFKNDDDKALILIALVNASYEFCYDVTTTLGKYFHAQKEIGTSLIVSKLSNKYGTNRSLPNGLYCILPMLVEAGFLIRPKVGVYQIKKLETQTAIAKEVYKQSFFQNNPMLTERYQFENHFYFEFIG